MHKTSTIRCAACGLTNWSTVANCKRCGGDLGGAGIPSAFAEPLVPAAPKVSAAMHLLFFFLYVAGVGLSFATVFLIFLLGDSLKIVSVTFAIAAVAVGFVVPLAAVHYMIEAWKTRLTGKPYELSGSAKNLEFVDELTAGIPSWLKIVQGFIVVTVTGVSAAVSGQILNNWLPPGSYPVLLLGLPALAMSALTLVVSTAVIKAFVKTK